MDRQRRKLLQGIAVATVGTDLGACDGPDLAITPPTSPSATPRASGSPTTSVPIARVPASTAPAPTIVDAPPQNPILAFAPQSGGPGTAVQVSGSSYAPNIPVKGPAGYAAADRRRTGQRHGGWAGVLAGQLHARRSPAFRRSDPGSIRSVAMNDASEALASAPFGYTPPAQPQPSDVPPSLSRDAAQYAVIDRINRSMTDQEPRSRFAPNLRVRWKQVRRSIEFCTSDPTSCCVSTRTRRWIGPRKCCSSPRR